MEEKVYKYEPVTSSTEILNEIKYILETNKNIEEDSNYTPIILDESCVSLTTIYEVIASELYNYKEKKEYFSQAIDTYLKKHYNDSRTILYDLNFEKDEISIGFEKHIEDWDYPKIVFGFYNNDLYLKSSETYDGEKIFQMANEIIFEAYNELMKYKDLHLDSKYGIKTMNSNYIVNISHHGIGLCDSKDINPNFKLSKNTYQEDFTCDCNSRIILNAVKGIEEEIFKLTFVKIADCPNWMKNKLYEIRKKEIQTLKSEIKKAKEPKPHVTEETKPKSKFLALFKRTKK